MRKGPPRLSVGEAWWRRVEPSDGCWIWQGYIAANGYGTFSLKGRGTLYGHRVSYQLHHGEIPEGLEVRHKCDVRSCVNPEHLELGTREDNMKDMVGRGRANPWNRGMTTCKRGHNRIGNTHNNGACKACTREHKRRRRERGLRD